MDQIQELLNLEAKLGNEGQPSHLGNVRYGIHQKIKELRGSTPPVCHGEDDCSTMMLSMCPWRIDCGE